MNRVNPLHIGGLLLVILLFFIMQLSGAKAELKEVEAEYKQVSKLATEVNALKNIYGNKDKAKKSLLRILRLSSLRSANIKQKLKKNSLSVSSLSMDKNALNSLMGKLLNGAYNINAMKIKKLSKERVSFEMEIKW